MKFFKFTLFVILVTGVVLLLIKLFLSLLLFDDWGNKVIEDKENQILFANAYQSDGWNGATIELLKDNIFRYGDFGGNTTGAFKITNDTIFFDKDLIQGKKAVLRHDTSSINRDTFLMIYNNQGSLQRENRYRVHSNTNKTAIKVSILKETELEPD